MDGLVIALAGLALVGVGFVAFRIGISRSSRDQEDQRLEEYDFYPFAVNEQRHVEFKPDDFDRAVQYFLTNRNSAAAKELIVIGEQNFVRNTAGSRELQAYKRLYEMYDGDSVISDNDAYLENYKRIVTLLGRSFPNTGIEILLHNLVNPARSLVTLENGEVTGRKLEMGATNLVLDLKTRKYQNQDKLNYELNLGSRQFKCTTIPIFRPEYGLVGAICMNIDTRFLREEIRPHPEKLEAWIDDFLRTDFELEENILSPDEYQAALRGKRHFLDSVIRGGPGDSQVTRLSAIMFTDIVDYTSAMIQDETLAFSWAKTSSALHHEVIASHSGHLLKEMGDGILSSFDSVSDAVACARDLLSRIAELGQFQLRVGIHLGEVTLSGGDAFGTGVNIASRIHSKAQPGMIAVSDTVYNNIPDKEGLMATKLGPTKLKHVDEPISLYELGV